MARPTDRPPRRLWAIRWSGDERARVQTAARRRGLTASAYVRGTALALVDVAPADRTELRRQLLAIGNNLNQLTRLAHVGKLPANWEARFTEALAAYYDALEELRKP